MSIKLSSYSSNQQGAALVKAMGVSEDAIKQLAKLKKEAALQRIDSTKAG